MKKTLSFPAVILMMMATASIAMTGVPIDHKVAWKTLKAYKTSTN